MIDRKKSYSVHFLTLALLTILALGLVNYLSMSHNSRIDLTTDNRFTLSEGTEKIFERLTEPVQVTYYVDEQLPSKRVNLERDVRDKLRELQVSSKGKLVVNIERITERQAMDDQDEYTAKNIVVTVDAIGDTSAKARGVQAYYSSLEIRYGGADPQVINGIRNLVSKQDEYANHRVDTLEFDITYALLRMKNTVVRVPAKTLIATLDGKVQFLLDYSEQMPASNPKLATHMAKALDEFKQIGGENVDIVKKQWPYGKSPDGRMFGLHPYDLVQESPTTGNPPSGMETANFFTAFIRVAHRRLVSLPIQFSSEDSSEAVIEKLEDAIWEIVKPRNRVAVIRPEPSPMQRGGSPYDPVINFLQSPAAAGGLGYDVATIDWKKDTSIPKDTSLLVVFESNKLSARQLFEVDRYLVQGGDVIMFHQAWNMGSGLGLGKQPTHVTLTKETVNDVVRDWAKSYGVEFSDDLLIHRDGTLKPYTGGQTNAKTVFTDMTFAVLAQQSDYSQESVFARGLTDMPLPLAVSMEIDESKISSAGLSSDRLLSMKPDGLYKYIPENHRTLQFGLLWSFDDTSDRVVDGEVTRHAIVEPDADADPDEHKRLQALGEEALLGLTLTGEFTSFWGGNDDKVPAWTDGRDDPFSDKRPLDVTQKPGKLTFLTSAGTLNTEYLQAMFIMDEEGTRAYIQNSLRFYRNFMDASIYGEELVGLRARSGVAPRIRSVEPSDKTIWYLVCIGGTPLALGLAALLLNLMRASRRREYETALGIREATND